MLSSSYEQFYQWITFDRVFGLSLLVTSLVVLAEGVTDLYIGSQSVPQFARILLYFGKTGREESSKRSIEEGSWLSKCISSLLKSFEVPKSWFGHFYVYFMAVWCLLVYKLYINNPNLFNHLSVDHLLLACLLVQSCRRFYETNFVSIYSGNGWIFAYKTFILYLSDYNINWTHYMAGYLFYSTLGYITYISLKDNNPSSAELPTLCDWLFFVIFLISSYIQLQSHVILAQLRSDKNSKDGSPSQKDYHIPKGGLFGLIVCPHYLTEIIIYFVLYLLSPKNGSYSFSWLNIALFVAANQVVAALATHRWYRHKFGDKFSPQVKALIPFVL